MYACSQLDAFTKIRIQSPRILKDQSVRDQAHSMQSRQGLSCELSNGAR
jgi:hypothetical protein